MLQIRRPYPKLESHAAIGQLPERAGRESSRETDSSSELVKTVHSWKRSTFYIRLLSFTFDPHAPIIIQSPISFFDKRWGFSSRSFWWSQRRAIWAGSWHIHYSNAPGWGEWHIQTWGLERKLFTVLRRRRIFGPLSISNATIIKKIYRVISTKILC